MVRDRMKDGKVTIYYLIFNYVVLKNLISILNCTFARHILLFIVVIFCCAIEAW